MPIALASRKTIRQDILRKVAGIISTASVNGDATTLTDTVGLAAGGDDWFNNWHLQMNTGSNNTGLKRWISDFDGSLKKLTFAALTDAVTAADTYELWPPPYNVDLVNSLIADAERQATPIVLIPKENHGVFTQTDKYLYDIPSGFVAISSLEYNSIIGEEVEIDDCDIVWSELVDGDVTASKDSVIHQEGTGCLKLVVAAGCSAGDILAAQVVSADLRECSEVEIWIYSTVALDAGDIDLRLSATALGASTTESLDIPATSANTWTRHIISLANPQNDSAIISAALVMTVDKGAFTLYADYILAVRGSSRVYTPLAPNHWDIVRGTTNYMHLKASGLSVTGTNRILRLRGYAAITAMSADSSVSDVDPAFIANYVMGQLLLSYAAPPGMDNAEKLRRGKIYAELAESMKSKISTSLSPGVFF